MNQTTLTDQDRAIISRLKLAALRNESRIDDATDYRAMMARERFQSTRQAGRCKARLPESAVWLELTAPQEPATLRAQYDNGMLR